MGNTLGDNLKRCVGLLLAAAFPVAIAVAQDVPAGWQSVQVRYTNMIPAEWEKAARAAGPPGSCQISVPADWKPEPQASGSVAARAPGSSILHPLEAEVQATTPGPTFAQQVQIMKDSAKAFHVEGVAVIEDSGTRFWTEQKPVPQYTEWRVMVPGRPNCQVSIRFAPKPGNDALARKIAATLRPAK